MMLFSKGVQNEKPRGVLITSLLVAMLGGILIIKNKNDDLSGLMNMIYILSMMILTRQYSAKKALKISDTLYLTYNIYLLLLLIILFGYLIL